MIDWENETPLIKAAALLYQIDWKIPAGIRNAENGGPGREFGVLSVPAPTYGEQLAVACASVRNRLADYHGNPWVRSLNHKTQRWALMLSQPWLEVFRARWAPPDVTNDPHGLNANWIADFLIKYNSLWLEETNG